MKLTPSIPVTVLCDYTPVSFSRLTNGGANAHFRVDADTCEHYPQYGPTTGAIRSDDWLSPLTANSTIDTFNAAYYSLVYQRAPCLHPKLIH